MKSLRNWLYKRKKVHSKTKDVPNWYVTIEQQYLKLLDAKLVLDEQINDLRTQLLTNMTDDGYTSINTDKTCVYVIHEHKGRKIDVTKLKNEEPAIFAKYSKVYNTQEHLQITIKKQL